jgi:hypothetical protein
MLELIRRAGGGVVFEEYPGEFDEDALRPDEADRGRAGQAREASHVTRRMLVDEANGLAETLDRLRHGECGITERTGEVVTAATPGGPRVAPDARHRGP